MSDQVKTPKTFWEADSTNPPLAEKIRESMRGVKDPELGLNIIELGLVRQVSIQDSSLHIRMILTTPFCPYGPSLLDMARQKAEEASGLEATIELGMEPWHPSFMEDEAAAGWGFF